jgi:hypothetical protein
MALKNSKKMMFLILLTFLFTGSLQAKIILPELLAKQAVGNIRFLSQDGKFTYYQKRSGSLLYSTNYKVVEMIKGQIGTQYTMIGTNARKKIIVMQNETFHTFYALRAQEKIFLLNFGDTTLREVGMGSAAALHLNDSWVSYYDYYSKVISFVNTTNAALKFTIKLNNKINPYFTPQVVMGDENTIYYTDLSETGAVGLLQYQRNVNKAEIIFKANTPMLKAEICLNNDSLIMGLFGINYSKEGTTIYKAALPIADFAKRETIYNSTVNDVGQMVCDFSKENITFIKNFSSNERYSTDLVDLNTTTKSITLLSEMKTITSVVNMDGTLLALDKGKYFIVKGNTDYKNIDSLKSLPPSGAVEAIKQIDKDREND